MKKQIYIFILLFLSVQISLIAQKKVFIPDLKFRNYLQLVYPFLIEEDSIDLNETNKIVGSFNVQGLGIENIEGIQYFTEITALNISYNHLKKVPREISNLKKLQKIVAVNNQINECPFFKNMPQLKIIYLSSNQLANLEHFVGLPLLEELYIDNNQLIKLPQTLNSFQNLEIIVANDNQLKSLPYVIDLKNITLFSIYNNKLTFEQLEIIANIFTKEALFNYLFPQEDIQLVDTVKHIIEGEKLFIQLPTQSPNSIYHWYQNEAFVKTTTTNTLTINQTSLNQGGIYYCEIENTLDVFGANRISTSRIMVDVDTCLSYSNAELFLEDEPTCLSQGKIKLEHDISSENPVQYLLKNITYDEIISQTIPEFFIKKGGTYELTLQTNNKNCTKIIYETLWVDEIDCPTYKGDLLQFSPNNDREEDQLFLNYIGKILIYDRNGKLVRHLIGPVSWDGLDDYKQELTTGLYFIHIEEDVLLEVTLIR